MAVANSRKADLTSDGDSDWVPMRFAGHTVQVDCVDANGASTSWGSVSVSLLYSVDGLMRCVMEDPDGNAITGKTASFNYTVEASGFVAIAATGISGETVRVAISDKTKQQTP